MIKKVCYCDKCETVAENPVAIDFGYLNVEFGEVDEWPDMPKELCESCAKQILSGIMEKQKKQTLSKKGGGDQPIYL